MKVQQAAADSDLPEQGATAEKGQWLQKAGKIIKVVGTAAGVLLGSPLKLPGKVLKVVQYLVVLAGLVSAADSMEDKEYD